MKYFVKNKENKIIIILLLAFLWNLFVYNGARLIAKDWHHYDMTTAFDMSVPFLPWTVSIYFGCYIFWGINYFLCATQKEPDCSRFFCADMFSKGICFLLFIIIPTTNIRPEVPNENIWNILMQVLYKIDSADNLFPSIHCLMSWFCWIGIRKNKNIPVLYRIFSFLAAVAVCVSTLTTKQHVIIDALAGILLAEVGYYLAGYQKIRNYYTKLISFLEYLLPK